MNTKDFISINQLCSYYKTEVSFFEKLNEFGLIEITTIEQSHFIHQEKITDIEKIVRLHHDLNINLEGIDVIFNLLQKIDNLNEEMNAIKNRLSLYENE